MYSALHRQTYEVLPLFVDEGGGRNPGHPAGQSIRFRFVVVKEETSVICSVADPDQFHFRLPDQN